MWQATVASVSAWWYGSGRARVLARRRGPAAATGRWGERQAARFLRAHGYRVLGQGVVIRDIEIDLVAEAPDADTVVIVEVKAGRTWQGHRPEDRVDREQRKRLRRAATWLRAKRDWLDRPMRFDVIAVEGRPGETPTIRHYPAAF